MQHNLPTTASTQPTVRNVSSYQMLHIKLGHLMLGVIITIPRSELGKFMESDNKLYEELLSQIKNRLTQILQKEQNRKKDKKCKTKGNLYHVYENERIQFMCHLKSSSAQYCIVSHKAAASNVNTAFRGCTVSPLCLSVYAVTKEATLPCVDSDEVNVLHSEAANKVQNKPKRKRQRKRM
mmetsp:Transcript_30287/g.49317  ORF Transcript_30287/g.49317 Transcript_30287/m.49317 type:complete len:180 (-) Transcript_30287:2-541(-)